MARLWQTVGIGLVGGLVAAAAMDAFQRGVSPLMGGGSNDDPSTIKAADSASRLVTGEPVTQKRRETAGTLVHYATGAAIGIAYGALAAGDPRVSRGFGVPFGMATMLAIDDVGVPAFGWGPAPQDTSAAMHAYSAASHAVFGVVLEGVRRGLS
ncbi:DUF1440 domain-containing protein [uncultured Sphingomonas sp.]|uniref:DUF1440 domain-containing protein n=1 Tax=uncultured Sphingomonas sp. TaxID=158754 RepID=UPI0026200DA5|nr:DUF1440 domain-containing protein [uncultured Sphingomonas sp.]